MKKMMMAVAVLGLSVPFAADAKPLKQANHKKSSAVSGYTGATTVVSVNVFHAVTGIEWREAGDAACFFRSHARDLENVRGPSKAYSTTKSLECGKRQGWGSTKKTYFGGDYFVHAIKVCTSNNKQTRKRTLKGIKIYAARVQDSPIKVTAKHSVTQTVKRTNCKIWHKKVSCGDRRVAYGYKFHKGDNGAYGIELLCTDLMAR